MDESVASRFKKRLRDLRRKRGWTQEQAAEFCGLGYKLYQLYEIGIKQNPGLFTLEKIARGYGLDISELLAPALTDRSRAAKENPSSRRKRTPGK